MEKNRFQGTVMSQSEICESKLSRNIAGLFVLDNSWMVEKNNDFPHQEEFLALLKKGTRAT